MCQLADVATTNGATTAVATATILFKADLTIIVRATIMTNTIAKASSSIPQIADYTVPNSHFYY